MDADNLLNLGFVDIEKWTRTGDWLAYQLDGVNSDANEVLLDKPNALYAFSLGSDVLYIGKTARSIRKRFVGYCRPGISQATNLRCHHKIKLAIDDGKEIRVLVFAPIPDLRYSEFEINLAAGLEDSLIRKFDPPWNGGDRGKTISESAEREEIELGSAASLALSDGAPVMPSQTSQPLMAFTITLGATYFNKGILNPGIRASEYLGAGGDPIRILFSDGSEPVVSIINRTANSNGSVRVLGCNQDIARWFQQHFREGDVVQGEVLDPHTIRLLASQN